MSDREPDLPNLPNHWQEIEPDVIYRSAEGRLVSFSKKTLLQLNPKQIALDHLQACQAQINGYWDEDEFYETISFTQMPDPELISSSLGLSPINPENPYWLQLKFTLSPNPSHENLGKEQVPSAHDAIPTLGELILLLDENLQVVDENWLIDLQSPYVLARP